LRRPPADSIEFRNLEEIDERIRLALEQGERRTSAVAYELHRAHPSSRRGRDSRAARASPVRAPL